MMAYNRPDPQVHRWFIAQIAQKNDVNSMLTGVFNLFAIIFMQL